jgi:allophanate hydrolase subunit 1
MGLEEVIKELHSEQEQRSLPDHIRVIKVNEIVELKPGGSNLFVTFDSMQEYLDLFRQKVFELVVGSVKRQF